MNNNTTSDIDPDSLPYPVPIRHIDEPTPKANKFERQQCVRGCRFVRKITPDTGDPAMDLFLTVFRCAFLRSYFNAQPEGAKKYFKDDVCRPGRVNACPENR